MKILCLDFDGVIHSYKSGWKGADVIPDGPVPGAMAFICAAVKRFEMHIYSSRSDSAAGITAMQEYLRVELQAHCMNEGLPQAEALEALAAIRWPSSKPPAFLTLDDRAWQFQGVWPALDAIEAFQPWGKLPPRLEVLDESSELKHEDTPLTLRGRRTGPDEFPELEGRIGPDEGAIVITQEELLAQMERAGLAPEDSVKCGPVSEGLKTRMAVHVPGERCLAVGDAGNLADDEEESQDREETAGEKAIRHLRALLEFVQTADALRPEYQAEYAEVLGDFRLVVLKKDTTGWELAKQSYELWRRHYPSATAWDDLDPLKQIQWTAGQPMADKLGQYAELSREAEQHMNRKPGAAPLRIRMGTVCTGCRHADLRAGHCFSGGVWHAPLGGEGCPGFGWREYGLPLPAFGGETQ